MGAALNLIVAVLSAAIWFRSGNTSPSLKAISGVVAVLAFVALLYDVFLFTSWARHQVGVSFNSDIESSRPEGSTEVFRHNPYSLRPRLSVLGAHDESAVFYDKDALSVWNLDTRKKMDTPAHRFKGDLQAGAYHSGADFFLVLIDQKLEAYTSDVGQPIKSIRERKPGVSGAAVSKSGSHIIRVTGGGDMAFTDRSEWEDIPLGPKTAGSVKKRRLPGLDNYAGTLSVQAVKPIADGYVVAYYDGLDARVVYFKNIFDLPKSIYTGSRLVLDVAVSPDEDRIYLMVDDENPIWVVDLQRPDEPLKIGGRLNATAVAALSDDLFAVVNNTTCRLIVYQSPPVRQHAVTAYIGPKSFWGFRSPGAKSCNVTSMAPVMGETELLIDFEEGSPTQVSITSLKPALE